MNRITVAALIALAVSLAACSEKPQTAGAKKADAHPWEGAQAAYTEKGWKAGDQASWESQMRERAQAQNDYARSTPASKP
jgi:hypothetical protein